MVRISIYQRREKAKRVRKPLMLRLFNWTCRLGISMRVRELDARIKEAERYQVNLPTILRVLRADRADAIAERTLLESKWSRKHESSRAGWGRTQ